MRNLRHLFRRDGLPSSEKRRRRSERSRRQPATRRRLCNEALEKRELLASDLLASSHNFANRYDVNADNQVSAMDALGVINYLSRGGEGETSAAGGGKMFYDVNNDSQISAADALGVINALSRGEGETGMPMVTLDVDNLNILEPDVTTGNPFPQPGGVATFTATLSAATDQIVTVDLNFGGTATLLDDYTRSGTQIVIPIGMTTGSVTVTAVEEMIDDADDEENETVTVEIDSVTNAMEAGTQESKTTIREKAPLVELVLTIRDLNDQRIPEDGNGEINLMVGDIVDAEISHDDRRFGGAQQGLFKLLVDLTASDASVLTPILNETQGFQVDNPALEAAAMFFQATGIEFSIPQFPPGVVGGTAVTLTGPDGELGTMDDVASTTSTTYVADIGDYGENATREVINALLTFGYSRDQFELSTSGSPQGFGGFDFRFQGDEIANIDLPNVAVDVLEVQGAANVATQVSDTPVFIGGGNSGTINPDAVANNINTHSRNFRPGSGGAAFYSLLNEGTYDPARGFIGAGGVGQGIRGGGIPAENTPEGSFVQPFDSFSFRFRLDQPINGLRLDITPGTDDEATLLYGRDDKTPSRLVLVDDVRDSSGPGSGGTGNANANETTGVGFAIINVTGPGGNLLPDITVEAGDSAAEGVTENGPNLMAAGTLTVTDADQADTVNASVVQSIVVNGNDNGISDATLLAMFSVGTNPVIDGSNTVGTIDFSFNSGSETFDHLAMGETLELTYTVRATDSAADSDDQAVVITVTGTNDDPAITVAGGDSASVVLTVDQNGDLPTASEMLSVEDLDVADVVTASVLANATQTGDRANQVNVDSFLTITNNPVINDSSTSGKINYTFDSAGENFGLLNGEQLVLTYTIRATDNQGSSDDRDVVVTINGPARVNNAPDINANGAGDSAAESVTENGPNLMAGGTLTVSDADQADVVDAALVSVTEAGDGTGIVSNSDLLSMFALQGATPVLDATETTDQLSYTFNSGAETFNFLALGETLQLQYLVRATDNQDTDDQVVVISVNGTNDAPTATDNARTTSKDAPSPVTGNVISDDNGNGVDSDPDNSDVLIVTDVNSQGVPTTVVGMFGSLVIQSSGSYSYTVNQGNNDVMMLGPNDPALVDSFVYTIDDQSGANNSSASATLAISITGVNDPPIARDNSNSVTEDTDLTAQGNLITDDDPVFGLDSDPNGDMLTVVTVGGSTNTNTAGNFGSLVWAGNGTYTYTLNNNNAAVQALGVNDTLTDTFTYSITDGNGGSDSADLIITINGNNDEPTATNNARTVAKGNSPIAGNVITDNDGFGVDSDPDGDNLSVMEIDGEDDPTMDVDGNFGTLDWSSNGGYSYQIDELDPAVANLQPGNTLVDTFTYTLSDGNGGTDTATLTVTITAVNPSTISGAIFINHFINGDDNEKDADESGLTGVGVQLVAQGGGVVATSVTDVEGSYTFRGVLPGDYLVVYNVPASVIFTGPTAVPISIGSSGGQTIVGTNFALNGLQGSISSVDIIASSYLQTSTTMSQISDGGREGGVVALDGAGNQEYLVLGSGYPGIVFAELVLNANEDAALLTVVDTSGDLHSALLTESHFVVTADGRGVQFFGGMNDLAFTDTTNAQSQAGFSNWRNAVDRFFESRE